MRYVVVIGIFLLCGIAIPFFGIFFAGKYFFDEVNTRSDLKEQKADEKSEWERATKRSVYRGVNADDFDIKALREKLETKKYTKKNLSSDLTKLIAKAENEGLVKLGRWYEGETDEDLEQIERYEAKYRKLSEEYEARRKILEEKEREAAAKLNALEEQFEKKEKLKDLALKKGKDVVARCERALKKFHAAKEEEKGTPKFRKRFAERKVAAAKKELDALQKEQAETVVNIETVQRAFKDIAFKFEHAQERHEALVSQIEAAEKNSQYCRKAQELARQSIAATREIREIKAQILKIEETREDKKVDLI